MLYRVHLTIGLLIAVLAAGCAQRVAFNPSPVVPAADANAKVTRDRNNNARVRVETRHLADPQRLNPPRDVYVVWAETPEGRTFNLGQLAVDANRRGRLETTTPLDTFRLLITAETLDAASGSRPGQEVLKSTEFFVAK